MRRPVFIAAFLIAAPAFAETPPSVPPAPPDPELLEFLGEIGGESPEMIQFVSTHEARRALKDAEKDSAKDTEEEKSKEQHDE